MMAALDAGVHGYVPKSLGPAELAHALGLILQGTIFVPSSLADLRPDEDVATEVETEARFRANATTVVNSAARTSARPFDLRQVKQGNCSHPRARRGDRKDTYGGAFPKSGRRQSSSRRCGRRTTPFRCGAFRLVVKSMRPVGRTKNNVLERVSHPRVRSGPMPILDTRAYWSRRVAGSEPSSG